MLQARRTRRIWALLAVLGVVAAAALPLAWHFMGSGFAPRLPPGPLAAEHSRTAPPMEVQAAARDSSEKLLHVTRAADTSSERGETTVGFKMAYSPSAGWQPLWNYPVDLAPCSEAAVAPALEWHRQWVEHPDTFRERAPKTYDLMLASPPSEVWAMGREPLLAAREAMALTGQRVPLSGEKCEPLLVYVRTLKPGDAKNLVSPVHVPFEAVVEFDRVAWTLTSVFEKNAYPFIAHLCADYLDEQGEDWDSQVPEPFSDLFAGDRDLVEHWDPKQLSKLGRAIYEALEKTGDLPNAYFGKRHDILQRGSDGTPFRGGGFGANLGALLWGSHFESYFHGDAALAAKVAAFLAANTKARIQSVPDKSTKEPTNKQRQDNGAYVTLVANTWFSLGGTTLPDKWVSPELVLPAGEEDLSYNWIRFMQEYVSRVLPLSNRFKVYEASELQDAIRTRRLLPSVFIDQSIPRLPK